jgi:DNA polymerase-3 subunit alpha
MYLNCHSYYSLHYGTLSIEQLVEEAHHYKIPEIALTDINSSSGIIDFVKLCKDNGIIPVAGIEFRNNNYLQYIGIAKNNKGFRELNEYLSEHLKNETSFPQVPPYFYNAFIVYPLSTVNSFQLKDNEYIGIYPFQLNRLELLNGIIPPNKCVVLYPITLGSDTDYEVHLNLRAIDNNTIISRLTPQQVARKYEKFVPYPKIKAIYADFPYLITNTEKLLSQCSIEFDFSSSKNKKTFTCNSYNDQQLLNSLVTEGVKCRYGNTDTKAVQRVKAELEVIHNLGFTYYFLIAWDIINYATSKGFYYVGRGSGANSIVAYCLRITNVDPIELDLYFERFINPKRCNPPDFDIDFSWNERDIVVDYIFKRYNYHSAFLSAISTFRDRSIIRELGKVNGLPKQEIDLMIKNIQHPALQTQLTKKIIDIGSKIVDFPNVRSVHAGGIIISEHPITCYTAMDSSSKGFPVTQFDMYTAEEFGFAKIDILSQRGIGHIKDCVKIIKQNKGMDIDIYDFERFKHDEETLNLLKKGNTTGCFYIESPGMRGLLKKLNSSDYLSLVAASSIIRPGVARSGMMREYIRRFHNPNAFTYPHPIIQKLLHETYGIMVYQEDVLKVAHYFAGFDLADADILRRAMSGKHRSKDEFKKIKGKFFDNCYQRGYSTKLIQQIWEQIESFAGYSFSKAHSASYAMESFQSLFLKAHYPVEHTVAVINNFGGFYQTWVYVIEARKCGAIIHLPCVNDSQYLTYVEGKHVYLGFIHIQAFESHFSAQIIDERNKHGNYSDLYNFIVRLPVGLEQLILLIRTGAFQFTHKSKKELLWEAHFYLRNRKTQSNQLQLFSMKIKHFNLPSFSYHSVEDAYDELELLGFTVSCQLFDLIQLSFVENELKNQPVLFTNNLPDEHKVFGKTILARQMVEFADKNIWMLGLLVTIKNVITINSEQMQMVTFFDIENNFFDSVHFPSTLKKYRLTGHGIYLLYGKISVEYGFPNLIVEKMIKVPLIEDVRFADFTLTEPLEK